MVWVRSGEALVKEMWECGIAFRGIEGGLLRWTVEELGL